MKRKSAEAKGVLQPFHQQQRHAQQVKVIAQLKTVLSAQSVNRPVAPPAYKPQPRQKVAQARRAVAQARTGLPAQSVKGPVAPPVYRPQPPPRVLQTKASSAQNPSAGQARRRPVAPPVYRPVTKKIVQPKAISQVRRSPAAPPVYGPEQKQIAEQKKASFAAASTRSVQRQLNPGHYKVNCHANLREEGNGYKAFDQVKMNSPVKVLDPGGKPSNFKAGWVTNEHSWVKVEGKYLLNKSSGGQSAQGWVNDEYLVSAPPPKEKVENKVESLVEEDSRAFVAQVNRLSATFNKGTPEDLSVTVWLERLGANLSQTKPGTLAHKMNEDAQKSNSLFIIGETRANLAGKNWAQEIVQDEGYRAEYADTVRALLQEEPVPVPKTLARSVWEY